MDDHSFSFLFQDTVGFWGMGGGVGWKGGAGGGGIPWSQMWVF